MIKSTYIATHKGGLIMCCRPVSPEALKELMLVFDWKKALITPVFKNASRNDPAKYRPVSLTCICCKLLEHIVNRHILNHLDEHKILADSQHGFRKKRSCDTQFLLTCHDLSSVVRLIC